MNRTAGVFLVVAGVVVASVGVSGVVFLGAVEARAQAQYPVVEKLATRVIEKYQSSSCAELAAKRGQPPSPMEQRVVQLMHEDSGMRTAFLDRVAGPIANKMFECRLIP